MSMRALLWAWLCCSPWSSLAANEGWSIGLGAVVQDEPYRGVDSDLVLFPFVAYEGERFFVRGPGLGVALYEDADWRIDGLALARFDGYRAGDSSALTGMATRRRSLDLGLAVERVSPVGTFGTRLLHDVLDRSGGFEWGLSYRVPLPEALDRLSPTLGIKYLSADLADYYYGVRGSEARPGRPAYAPGSSWVYEAGVQLGAPLGARGVVFALLGYEWFGASLRDSPIVAARGKPRVFLGYAYAWSD